MPTHVFTVYVYMSFLLFSKEISADCPPRERPRTLLIPTDWCRLPGNLPPLGTLLVPGDRRWLSPLPEAIQNTLVLGVFYLIFKEQFSHLEKRQACHEAVWTSLYVCVCFFCIYMCVCVNTCKCVRRLSENACGCVWVCLSCVCVYTHELTTNIK